MTDVAVTAANNPTSNGIGGSSTIPAERIHATSFTISTTATTTSAAGCTTGRSGLTTVVEKYQNSYSSTDSTTLATKPDPNARSGSVSSGCPTSSAIDTIDTSKTSDGSGNSSSKAVGWTRQLLTARKGQRPTAWIDFEEARRTMIRWEGYKIIAVQRGDGGTGTAAAPLIATSFSATP